MQNDSRIITTERGPKVIHMSLNKNESREIIKIVCYIYSICHSS